MKCRQCELDESYIYGLCRCCYGTKLDMLAEDLKQPQAPSKVWAYTFWAVLLTVTIALMVWDK